MQRLVVAAAVAASFYARPSDACGGMVSETVGGALTQTAQTAVIVVGAETTDLVLAIDVPGADEEFGVLVPVPVEPTISATPVAVADLEILEENTRPLFSLPTEAGGGGGGCGCAAPSRAGDGFGNGQSRGVVSGDPVDVGAVTAQWLSGASGSAVSDWLSAEGFVLPDGAQATIDAYVAEGMSFVAMRRSAAAADAERVGVRLTMDGDRRAYAMRMTTVGGAETMAYTVFVAADVGVAPDAPYVALTLDDLDGDMVLDDYPAAVAAAVAGAGGKAFVVESTSASEDHGLPDLLPDGLIVTRLSSVAATADLDDDVTFTAPLPEGSIGNRVLSGALMSSWPPPLDFWAFLVFMTGVRVAWRRRRPVAA